MLERSDANFIIRRFRLSLGLGSTPTHAVNYLLDNWIWIVTALVSGGLLLRPVLGAAGGAGSIAVTEAVRLMNREKAIVIDVSEPDEYASAHINNARNIPLAKLETSKDVPTNKTVPLLLVCASGKRATNAASVLRKRGHEQVHVIAGGLAGWRDASLPIVRSGSAAG
jgi:rhodanese-related sulfurtransferase